MKNKKLTREDKISLLELARCGQYDPAKHQRIAELFAPSTDTSHYDYERLSSMELELVIVLVRKLQGELLGESYNEMLNAATTAAAGVLKARNMPYEHSVNNNKITKSWD